MRHSVAGRLSLLIVSQKKERFESQMDFLKGIISFFGSIESRKENVSRKNDFEMEISGVFVLNKGNFKIIFTKRGNPFFQLDNKGSVLTLLRKGDLEINLINLRDLFLGIKNSLDKDILVDPQKGLLLVPEKFLFDLNMRVEISVRDLGKFYVYF